MTRIVTSRGKSFEANWAAGPGFGREKLMISLPDQRPLSQICADFEDLSLIDIYEEEEEAAHTYAGFTVLTSAVRDEMTGAVNLLLKKGGEAT